MASERASYPAPRTRVILRVLLSRDFSRLPQNRELARRLVEVWSMFSFLGKFSVSLLTEVTGGLVSTAVAFSFHYYPWWNVAHTAEQYKILKRIWQYICFLRRKQVNHKILRALNVNSFREVFYHTFLHLLLKIISYTLYVLKFLLGYEFHLRFSVNKGFILNVNVKYRCVIFLSFTNI